MGHSEVAQYYVVMKYSLKSLTGRTCPTKVGSVSEKKSQSNADNQRKRERNYHEKVAKTRYLKHAPTLLLKGGP